MFSSDPDLLYPRRTLPPDWVERVAAFRPSSSIAPIVDTVQGIVQARGEQAIAIQQVQEVALHVCGMSDRPPLRDYDFYLSRIVRPDTRWVVDRPLNEIDAPKHDVLVTANKLTACDGEWYALDILMTAEWTPVDELRGAGKADWILRKQNRRKIAVEVKTKRALGSMLGALTLALRGVLMLPSCAFLNGWEWRWTSADKLREQSAAKFFQLLWDALPMLRMGIPSWKTQLAANGRARLELRPHGPHSFGLHFLEGDVQMLSIRAKRAPNDTHLYIGSPARISGDPEDELVAFGKSLDRLRIRRQAATRKEEDLLFFVVWEIPFPAATWPVEEFWENWCKDNGVKAGLLQRRGFGIRQPVLNSGAAALDLGIHRG